MEVQVQQMILVSGGAGYIGSNTIIALSEMGYTDILSVDNYSNSNPDAYKRLEKITGKPILHINCDLSDRESALSVFQEHKIEGIIHFAALKSVPESVQDPALYYRNNVNALINLIDAAEKYSIKKFIFSSSCTVYGTPEKLPVEESTPFGKAESPYGLTKQLGEMILENYCLINKAFRAISLRYFNPAGAHESGLTGEVMTKRPNNLVPILAQQAAGLREKITVFGNDYNTKDGSCVRDYIHVSDIAEAHVLAYKHLEQMTENYDVFNLGSGSGNTTLEVVLSFEKENALNLNYEIGGRRSGDVEKIYASNKKAKEVLGWKPKRDLKEIVRSAWRWQQNSPD